VLLGEIAHGGGRRVDGNAATIGCVEACQDAEERRLANAVRPDDPDAGLRSEEEVDIDEDRRQAARLREAMCRNCGGRGR
jgi:hypothetical protein